MKNTNLINLQKGLQNFPKHSARNRALINYANEILENLQSQNSLPDTFDKITFEKFALNGASSWFHYSWSGCSHCCDYDIAKELCTPSEFKRRKEGAYRPGNGMEWLDLQANALKQAFLKLWNNAEKVD